MMARLQSWASDLLNAMPAVVWIFLLGQMIFVLIWGVRISDDIEQNMRWHQATEKFTERLDERQQDVRNRLSILERRVDWITQLFTPHSAPPPVSSP